MTTTTNRKTVPRDGDSVDHRLARLLDTPFLARVVPHLPPETLHQLIQHRGLDACGELVTAATPAQLTSLLDLDLWRRSQPGPFDGAQGQRDEQFDVDRFGEWLDVLVDTGDSVAARTVAALDKHLVIVGLSRYLRVFDPGIFEPTESTDDEPPDRNDMMNSETSGDVLECEVGGYLVRARRTDAWDAIVTLLGTLETEHNDYFHAVMQGCRRLSNSRAEIDGLDDLLTAPEQQLHDVAIEREHRRSRHGYVIPADARAFLQMARKPRAASAPTARSRSTPSSWPTFARPTKKLTPHQKSRPQIRLTVRHTTTRQDDVNRRGHRTAGRGRRSRPAAGLLEAADEDPLPSGVPLLRRLMTFVLHDDETAHLSRSREFAFLANTLVAGSSVQSRPFTPQEASDAAACICNLGLECWPARWPGATSHGASSSPERETAMPPDAFLVDHDLVTAFEVGWSVLHQDVSLFVADQLVSMLAGIQCADAETRHGLRALRRRLMEQREAGTPGLARDAADVLAMLDMTAWISVLGLMDECPILPAALRAVLERRTTSVSPTAFEFISTIAQIGDIRLFMRALPGVLSG